MTTNCPRAMQPPRGARLRRGAALLALVPTALASLGAQVAVADNVTNNVTTPGKIVSTTVNAPATVTFSLVETSGGGDAGGCNATSGDPVVLTASGTGVVVDHDTALGGVQSSRSVESCGSWAFTFTSATTGDKAITVAATGGKTTGQAASSFNTAGAAFTLSVGAAAPTAAATSLALATATGTYDQASTSLLATLTSGSTGVAGKTVSFTVGGVPVGNATTQADGVATLAYSLDKAVAAGTHVTRASWSGDTSFASSNSPASTLTIEKAAQSVTFNPLANKVFGDTAFVVAASASSALPVTFASTTPSVCAVSGASVTIAAAGTCSLTAAQPGDSNWNPATSVIQAFQVAKASQTINLQLSRSTATYQDSVETTVTTGATSTLPVTLSVSGPCTLDGNTLTAAGAGNCVVTGTQGGNDNFLAATDATQTLNVAKAAQSITFNQPAGKTFGDSAFSLDATATSDLPVSYDASPANVCTVSGSTVSIGDAGTCTIIASQSGNDDFNSAGDAVATFTVAQAAQAITFGVLGNKTFGDNAFPIAATAPGGPVSFTSAGTCTVADGTVTITGAGTCTITANQGGSTNYLAAPAVERSFTIAKAAQTITFPALSGRTYAPDLAPFSTGASSSAALPLTVTAGPAGICSAEDGLVQVDSAGDCTVTANAAGNENYNAAAPVSSTFTIAKAAQTITFDELSGKTYGEQPLSVGASGTSQLPVRFATSTADVCTVFGTTVTLVGAGTCSVTAVQAGNANWNAAENVTRSFAVARAALTVTAPSATRFLGAGNPTLTPSYSGFVNGDTASSLTSPATCSTTATVASPVGTYPVTCTGAAAANYAVTEVPGTLTVVHRYSGLLQPINTDRSSAFKSGSTIPVKFQVLDANDVVQSVSDLKATIKVTKLGATTAGTITEDVVTVAGDAGNTFRWDSTGRLYVYNLSTKTWSMGEGRYRVDVVDAAGAVLTSGEFQVKR